MRHIVVNHNENEPYPIKTCDQCDYSGTFTNLMYHKNVHFVVLDTRRITNDENTYNDFPPTKEDSSGDFPPTKEDSSGGHKIKKDFTKL